MANEILFIDYRLSLSINPKYNNAIDELKETPLTVYSSIINKIADELINYDRERALTPSRMYGMYYAFACKRNFDNEMYYKTFSARDIKSHCHINVQGSTLSKLVKMGLLKRFGNAVDGHTYSYCIPDDFFISKSEDIKFAE